MNGLIRIYISVFTILLAVCRLFPVQIQFDKLSIRDGLPDATIICMTKDRQGFMWFGTMNGLSRYDGYSFKNFLESDSGTNKISGRIIFTIIEDREGFLWIGSVEGGLNKFDPRTERFTHYRHDPLDTTSISHNNIYALWEDQQGRLWIGSRGGLDLFDKKRDIFIHYNPENEDRAATVPPQINAIYERNNEPGILWLGTLRDGLKRLDVENKVFTHYKNDPKDLRSLNHNNIWFVKEVQGSPSLIWIGTDGGGLEQFDIDRKSFTHFNHDRLDPSSISSDEVRSIMYDQSGVMWVGAGGLNQFGKKGVVKFYEHLPNDPTSLSSNNVLCMLSDENDVHWIGTRDGLNRFNSPKEAFTFLQHEPYNRNSLEHNFVWAVIEDRFGMIWIAVGPSGLNMYDPKTKHFTLFKKEPNNPQSLRNNSIRRIYEDRSGTLWIGNIHGVLHRFDRKTRTFKSYAFPRNPKNNRDYEIRTMVEDTKGTFWIGTTDGLFTFDRNKWRHDPVPLGPIQYDSITSLNQINSIFEDSQGILWFGTEKKGLIAYDQKAQNLEVFLHDSTNDRSISFNSVRNILEDKKGRLWFAAGAHGLNMYDRRLKEFMRYNKNTGLPDNAVFAIAEDDDGNLWLVTESSLCRLNPDTKVCRNFDERYLHQGGGLNSFASFKAVDGTLYFGGVNGLNIFHPKNIKDNHHIPLVYVTNIKVYEKSIQSDTSIPFLRQIRLQHNQNFIALEFSALDFKDQKENKYSYMLEGLDRSWINSGGRRYVSYPNLSPGEYIFRVKASNNEGIWNERGASLMITILPAWWASWWAYILYGIFGTTIILYFHRSRIAHQRVKHQFEIEHIQSEKLAELNTMKSRFLANVSHELRTPLSMIIGPVESMLVTLKDKEFNEQLGYVRRNAQKLLRLIELLLQFSRLEAGTIKLQVSQQKIIPFLRRVTENFASQAVKKEIELSFVAPDTDINGMLDMEKIEHIIQNCISNALKFTPPGGLVTVRVWQEGNELVFSIKDNGIGIAPEHVPHVFDRFYRVDPTHKTEGTGIGLSLSKELAEIHRGTMHIESELGKGSIVTVRIPLAGYDTAEITTVPYVSHEHIPTNGGSTHSDEQINGTASDKLLIIVAEDNDDARGFIRHQLSGQYTVIEAMDGEDAFHKTKFQIPDLVISDVMMPKMDGWELCHKLKNDERTSHIPVILLTALAEKEDKLKGLETGADDYLIKPFDAQELLVRVRNLLENRKKIRESYGKPVQLKSGEVFVTPLDEKFLYRAFGIVENHIAEPNFSVETFAHEMFLSRTQLQRKLKAITNLTPGDFIRYLRLQRAKELLEKNAGSIAEIADRVGFSNHSYFAKCFHEQFGLLPNEVRLPHK